MKRYIITAILAFAMAAAPIFLQAQLPPHPNGGNDPGSGNTPVGGGAPIDGGLSLMLAMAMGYGIKKTIRYKAK